MAVDNYQGEESDLAIGSFVLSNDSGQIGFIGDANRLNVAISRARCIHWPLCICMVCRGRFFFQAQFAEIFYTQRPWGLDVVIGVVLLPPGQIPPLLCCASVVQHFRFLVDFHRICRWHALELSAVYGESGTQSKTAWIVEPSEHRTKVLMPAEVTYEACVVSGIFQQDNDTARVDRTPRFIEMVQ